MNPVEDQKAMLEELQARGGVIIVTPAGRNCSMARVVAPKDGIQILQAMAATKVAFEQLIESLAQPGVLTAPEITEVVERLAEKIRTYPNLEVHGHSQKVEQEEGGPPR